MEARSKAMQTLKIRMRSNKLKYLAATTFLLFSIIAKAGDISDTGLSSMLMLTDFEISDGTPINLLPFEGEEVSKNLDRRISEPSSIEKLKLN